jgi:hypothetical protein
VQEVALSRSGSHNGKGYPESKALVQNATGIPKGLKKKELGLQAHGSFFCCIYLPGKDIFMT